jgi:hypothetical protein
MATTTCDDDDDDCDTKRVVVVVVVETDCFAVVGFVHPPQWSARSLLERQCGIGVALGGIRHELELIGLLFLNLRQRIIIWSFGETGVR